jgi:ubiquinone/menaquinone biosynthesis C-methylase UbiE
MLPPDFENYLGQIRRVLKHGGKCFSTFFTFTEATRRNTGSTRDFLFRHDLGHYLLMDDAVKEANVAYEWEYLTQTFEKKGLKVDQVHHGYWSGKPEAECLDFQDIVVLEKR